MYEEKRLRHLKCVAFVKRNEKKRQKKRCKNSIKWKVKEFSQERYSYFLPYTQLEWQFILTRTTTNVYNNTLETHTNKERRTFLSAFRNYFIEEWAAIDITEGGKVSNFLGVVNFSPFLHWSHATVGRYRFLTSFFHIGVQRQLMIVSKCLPL